MQARGIQMAENDYGRRRCRLVLVVSPLQGHMTPMLQLGTYFHSKGFSVTVAHSEFKSPNSSNHPNLIFLPLPDNLSATNISSSIIQVIQTLNDNCKPHLKEHLIRIVNTHQEKELIVIIYDDIMYFAGYVAGEMGLPSIIVKTSCAASVPAINIIPQLYREGRFPPQESLLKEIVPELEPFRYKDLPFIDRPIKETLQMISMITIQTPPSAFIWNTLEFLEQSSLTKIRDHYRVPVFTIGPLYKMIPTPSTSFFEEDTSCISWLDKQAPKSVIYVSLGSLATIDEKVLKEMAWGLVNSKQPFLWVVRQGSVNGFEWIECLEEGLMAEMNEKGWIVKWAPQKDVLAHIAVGGFWTHCGWNSTLECLSEGIPMLCQPLDIDQLLNARNLSYVWKTGVDIIIERGEIEGAIREILVGKEGDEMRKRAVEIQEKVKLAVSDGGSSQNSLNDLVEFIMSL